MDYEERFIKNLNNKKDGTFILVGRYINSHTKVLIRHTVCGHEWYTNPRVILSSAPTKGCPECQRLGNSILSKDFPDVFYSKIDKSEFTLDESVPYKSNTSDIYVYHNRCGNRFKTYWSTFSHNISCPNCRDTTSRRKSQDAFISEVDDIFGKGVYSVLTTYTTALEKVSVKHLKCGRIFSVRAEHLRSGHGCPYCYSSLGEIKVRHILNSLEYSFSEQLKFDACADKKPLPFDFYVKCGDSCKGFLIEYDGIQHFKPFTHFGGDKKYANQKYHDEIKNKFSIDSGIPLLRLSYKDTDDDISTKIQSMYKFVIGKNPTPNSGAKI